eukprot:1506741-Amphidinium_carterae.1
MTTYSPLTTRTFGTSENVTNKTYKSDQNKSIGKDSSTRLTRRIWRCKTWRSTGSTRTTRRAKTTTISRIT